MIIQFKKFKEVSINLTVEEANSLIQETSDLIDLMDREAIEDHVIEYHEARLDYLMLYLRNIQLKPAKRASKSFTSDSNSLLLKNS